MAPGRRQHASASPFALSFIAGTLCYSLRSFVPHPISGFAAFLIGFVGVFVTLYAYHFCLLYFWQRQPIRSANVLNDSVVSERKAER